MNPTIKIIFGLLGGLAIFIYGMNIMSESLQKVAGDKMKKILGLLTKNPVMGVFAGAFMTLVVQSSSATIAFLQNIASQSGADGVSSVIGVTGAIPILLGVPEKEIRVEVIGHSQRGGEPCAYDKILASRVGIATASYILEKKFGVMADVSDGKIIPVSLDKVAGKLKKITPDEKIIQQAKNLGICLGI